MTARRALVVATVVAVIAIVTATVTVFLFGRIQQQRTADRIARDQERCDAANDFRQQVIDQAHAVDALMTGVLDAAFVIPPGTSPEQAARIRQYRERFNAPLVAYRKVTGEIQLIDC